MPPRHKDDVESVEQHALVQRNLAARAGSMTVAEVHRKLAAEYEALARAAREKAKG